MFGYVIPPLSRLPGEEQERFQQVYCGLCHTLGHRYGLVGRMILNYDFTFLAILLSDSEPSECGQARCIASPCRKRCYAHRTAAMELAADESIILAYWQLRDGVADHGFWRGLKYRLLSRCLHGAYRKAAALRPDFDRNTREQLRRLSKLEQAHSASLDEPADTFAVLLAGAAGEIPDPRRQRILYQILYHLGRWIYLIDAADDLEKDTGRGDYNPLRFRYGLSSGKLDPNSRKAFVETIDHSVRMIASAYELADFGCWSAILESTVYTGLFQVGKAVLDGVFETSFHGRKRKTKKAEETIA